ncbi:MAG: guanylate kinase [unclassified Hahellaceae]|nr:guanylate kinase [Hahellaceae bacterium]
MTAKSAPVSHDKAHPASGDPVDRPADSRVHGQLFVISAPSGTGKTSLVTALLARQKQLKVSVSHTTRAPRQGEVDGEHYHFVTQQDFLERQAAGAFLESADVFGNLYGTCSDWVDEQIKGGIDVILEIDWQGAAQVRRLRPETRSIFILPPSLTVLESRLRNRKSDADDVVAKRLGKASSEMTHYPEYDYLIVNDDFDTALEALAAVFLAERHSLARQAPALADILSNLCGANTGH